MAEYFEEKNTPILLKMFTILPIKHSKLLINNKPTNVCTRQIRYLTCAAVRTMIYVTNIFVHEDRLLFFIYRFKRNKNPNSEKQ